MAAISDLEVTTNDYGTCVEFKPSGFKIQYLSATIQIAIKVLLPKKFTSTTYKAAQCKSEGSDGTTVVAEITSKSEDSLHIQQ